MDMLPITAAMVGLLCAGIAAQPANTILLERWDNVSGTTVANLTSNANYPNTPTARSWPTSYEMPAVNADNYGTRTRGYITPPTTGNYTFWIASDDASELWLGTSSNPATAQKIAQVSSWTNSREWTKASEQQSSAIALTAGVSYYIETRHKEGTGGDHLAVGWQGPGIAGDAERPIPGSRLSPFILPGAPSITAQPANKSVTVGQTANFTVTASGNATLAYQWRKNGANIPGATSASYTTPATVIGDNGSTFSVVVSNSLGSATSSNATLTVTTGLAAPVITAQPGNATITEYQTAVFSVTATGNPTPAYQWRKDGQNIPGATSSSYTTPAAPPSDNGAQFSVVVSNSQGSVTSSNAVLTVNFNAKISQQPGAATAREGQTAQFCVQFTANPAASIQWKKNGVIIGGATSACYTTPTLAMADNGSLYSVVLVNSMGSVSSTDAALTVTPTTFYADTLKAIKLVADTVVAEDLVITPVWRVPDYVFEPGYKVRSLQETSEYIRVNGHLPDVPSAGDIGKKGMSMTAMNLGLLKTVEEMTLHMIAMEKEIKALKASRQNESVKK